VTGNGGWFIAVRESWRLEGLPGAALLRERRNGIDARAPAAARSRIVHQIREGKQTVAGSRLWTGSLCGRINGQ